MWKWFRRLIMIIVPLMLALLEHEHAVGFSKQVYDGLIDHASWWKMLHIYQAFLFGCVAVAAYLLTSDINNIWATLSRIFLWTFLVAYLVFDSTAGISVGYILEKTKENPSLEPATIKPLVQEMFNDPVIGGTYSFFSLLGSFSWLFALVAAIIALYHKYRGFPMWKVIPPLALLAVSAYCLFIGHYPPYGPIAFTSFALASLWFEYFQFRIGEDRF